MKTHIRNYFTRLVFCLTALTISTSGLATEDWSHLHKKKQTKLSLYMTAQQAYDHTIANMGKTLFLDIRTPSELNYLGAATVMDAHVPFVLMDISGWNDKKHRYKRADNKNFVANVDARLKQKGLTKDDTVILMCRSGKRSASAVNKLAEAGYTKVYSVVDGYEGDKSKDAATKGMRVVDGWKNTKLPWTYSLDRDLMYFPE